MIRALVLILVLIVIIVQLNNSWFGKSKVLRLSPKEENESRRLESEGLQGLAWLMSFPNSGTTYSHKLIQISTGASVASNYGHELFDSEGNVMKTHNSIPVAEGEVNGPFRTSADLPLPSQGYLLTKTHCGGYCFSHCPPNWYRLSPLKFLQECVLGMRHVQPLNQPVTESWVQYDYHKVKKAVHLIRSPFDNIVSRFFHEFKMHRSKNDATWLATYPKTPRGFRAWCRDTDNKWRFHERTVWGELVFNATREVPCHGELIRYVKWHNNAFELTRAMELPTFVLHYEDYQNFDETLNRLLDFLGQTKVRNPIPFELSEHAEFYNEEERTKMIDFVRFLATNESWEHLQRYGDLSPFATSETNVVVVEDDFQAISASTNAHQVLQLINENWRHSSGNYELQYYNVQKGLQYLSQIWENEGNDYQLKYYNVEPRSDKWKSAETEYQLQYFNPPN